MELHYAAVYVCFVFFCTCVSVCNFFETNDVLRLLYVIYILWEVMFNKTGLKRKPNHVFEI